MDLLPELPAEAQTRLSAGIVVAKAKIDHARIHLERMASAESRLAALEFQVCTSGERLELEEERHRCLEQAKACVRLGTGELFDVCAAQYWGVICPDAEKFSSMLQRIREEVGRRISCPELGADVREALANKTVEWTERAAREQQNVSGRLAHAERIHRIVASFRSQYASSPARRTELLERLAANLLKVHLGTLIGKVINLATCQSFLSDIVFSQTLIHEEISFLTDDDRATAWSFVEAESLQWRAKGEQRARGVLPLPMLTSNDPQNCLSDPARRRVSDAYMEGEKIRARALAAVEARYRSESDPDTAFFEYCGRGQAALEINQAKLESVRLILSTVLREYKAAGKSGRELRQIMLEDELDALANSAELTTIERQMVELELDLYRMTPAEQMEPVEQAAVQKSRDSNRADQGFWRDLETRFRAIPDPGGSMLAESASRKSERPGDVLPAQEAQVPTESRKAKKPVRRNQKYIAIDEALQGIAESRPRTQEEVFQSLEGRHVVIPPAEPFMAARGWMAGFRQHPAAARAWLSKRWAESNLASLPRGPKK